VTRAWWRQGTPQAAVIVGVLMMTASAQASPSPVKLTYTGGEQSYTIPSDVTVLEVEMVGAFGGPDLNDGGDGTEFTAYLPVSAGETLYGEVGQIGILGGAAGFGGGGAAGTASAGGEAGGSGGGASDVRTCSLTAPSCPGGGTSLGSRLIVAGGGGGEGGSGLSDGIDCGNGPYGGSAEKYPPGGTHVQTAAGLVITGGNSEGEAPSTAASGGGSTTAGTGGAGGDCAAFSGSVAGQAGSGPVGGAGGSAIAKPGGGGGGGGGYFGGGGGASGQEQCIPTCTDFVDGAGGAAGSSFITASAVLAPLSFDDAPFPPSITFTPAVEIDSPTNGAQYAQEQSVPVSFTCNIHCSGTVASGQPLPTSSAGPETFTVTAEVNETPITTSVSYTVIAGAATTSPGPPAATVTTGSTKSPPPTKIKPLTSSQKRAKAIAACKKLKNAHKWAKCIAAAMKRYPLHPKAKHKKT
jgi:hypothetical protein